MRDVRSCVELNKKIQQNYLSRNPISFILEIGFEITFQDVQQECCLEDLQNKLRLDFLHNSTRGVVISFQSESKLIVVNVDEISSSSCRFTVQQSVHPQVCFVFFDTICKILNKKWRNEITEAGLIHNVSGVESVTMSFVLTQPIHFSHSVNMTIPEKECMLNNVQSSPKIKTNK